MYSFAGTDCSNEGVEVGLHDKMPGTFTVSQKSNAYQLQDRTVLAKDQHVSNGGRPSGVTSLRTGKKPAQEQLGKRSKTWGRKSPADIKVSKGGGGGGNAPGARARIPPQPMEIHGGAEIPPAAAGGVHTRAGGHPKEVGTPWKALSGTGSQQHLWPCGERSLRCNRFAVRTCDSAGKPLWSRLVMMDSIQLEEHILEQLMKNSSPIGGTHMGAVGRVWGWRSCRAPGHNSYCPFLLHHWEWGSREFWSEVKSRKKRGVGGRCFKIWVCFLLQYFGNKLNSFP